MELHLQDKDSINVPKLKHFINQMAIKLKGNVEIKALQMTILILLLLINELLGSGTVLSFLKEIDQSLIFLLIRRHNGLSQKYRNLYRNFLAKI